MFDDTIAAIATPLGQGGLAIIRLSGERAVPVGDAVFHPPSGNAETLANANFIADAWFLDGFSRPKILSCGIVICYWLLAD